MPEFHSLTINKTLKSLHVAPTGLKQVEAEKRHHKHGPNEIQEEKSLGAWQILLTQFKNPLAYVLLIAGTLSLVLGSNIDAGVIFGALVLNAIIGFFQENKANKSITKLKSLVEHKAMVVRDGQELLLDSRLLTIGDIILTEAGNRIPADGRIIEANELKINESMLTGESLPSNKKVDEIPAGAALADRKNMVYAGTMVLNGRGRAVITAIGHETEIGKIAALVAGTKEGKTPLQLRLNKFSRLLAIIFAVVCSLIIIIGLAQGRELLDMIATSVAIGVASIPEGLTVAVTFILALGMQRILKKRALTRKLVAAETLGSITVICSDKTGTLTEGKMHVAHIVVGEKEFEIDSPGTRQEAREAKAVSLALQTAMMCNDAIIENPQDDLASWRFVGTPTEAALYSAAIQSGLRKNELEKIEPKIDESPFTSEKKFMLSLHQTQDAKYVLYEKGAPEKLLDKSSHYYHAGAVHHLTATARDKLEKNYVKLTSHGLRVIAVCIKKFSQKEKIEKGKVDWEEIDTGLTFIGFIAIKDPLRPEAKATIKECRQAGIRPIIITGDHQLTAQAIAREVGLKAHSENIITGPELDKVADKDLTKLIKKIDVYARVSPHHKLRIVKCLQEKGEVVAMTGDGINDSPALKAADIGISLGTGTDIAKETSDIVLLDNNFKTIVSAVRQGRVIFKNIRKVITYLLSDSFTEMILIVGTIVVSAITRSYIPLAILPAQILWINIINDGLPDFSLAFEDDHGHVMTEKPIKKNEPLLNKKMIYIIFVVGVIRDFFIFGMFYILWLKFSGTDTNIDYLRTLIFVTIGLKSLMSIFSIRSFRIPVWRLNPLTNKYMIIAVALSCSLLVLGVYWSPLQTILHTTGNFGINGWLVALAFGVFNILLIEMVKHYLSSKKAPIAQ